MILTTLTVTLGFAFVYISLLMKSLYVYYVFHLIMFCYMLPHIVLRYEIDRYVVMDRLEVLTVESYGKIIGAHGLNFMAVSATALE